jgi:hypothetical protein
MVKNRDRWTIEAIHRDGAITAVGRTGQVRLPAAYVADHVELAYAQTCHASQGRTVDRSILYLDTPKGAAGIYVPMTRGRESNEAFVVLRGEETPADVIAEALSRSWIDWPAVAVRADLTPAPSSRDGDGTRSGPERPLGKDDLVRLLERDAKLERAISSAQTSLDIARRRVVSLGREHTACAGPSRRTRRGWRTPGAPSPSSAARSCADDIESRSTPHATNWTGSRGRSNGRR